jgi:hypothetical protein
MLSISRRKLGELICSYIIIFPAIIDWFHGYLEVNFNITFLSSAYRLSIIVMMAVFVSVKPDKHSLILLLSYILFAVTELFLWSTFTNVQLPLEMKTFINATYFIYCFILLAKVAEYFTLSKTYILSALVNYGIITSIIVIISLVFDIGIPTYSNQSGQVYGFGTQSYYIAGNVLGLTIAVSQLVAVYKFIQKVTLINFIKTTVIFIGGFSVGSRTGMVISALIYLSLIIYMIFLLRRHYFIRGVLSAVFIPFSIFIGLKAYEVISQYSRMIEKLNTLLSGNIRGQHAKGAVDFLAIRSDFLNVFGESYDRYIHSFVEFTPKQGKITATAEQDLLDVLGAYGIFGAIFLFLPYIICLIYLIIRYIRHGHQFYLFIFGCVLMLLGHSIIAGHVIFSSKASQFASIFMTLALLYNSRDDYYLKR